MVPPTQLLAQLRRILQCAASNATRSRNFFKSAGRRSGRRKGRKRPGLESSRRLAKFTVDALSRVREGSPFNDGPGALQRPASPSDSEFTTDTEEEDEADDQEDDDDQDEEGVNGDVEGMTEERESNLPVTTSSSDVVAKESSGSTRDSKSLLDFNPDSSANRQLLGSWSRCTLLMDMLHLTYELLLVSRAIFLMTTNYDSY